MPYSFEATFTQPLLAKLDAGSISDARSWADAITDQYLLTIKQGLPNGVPPVLPAPGLNPTGPPPPFNIGASPFLTADSRRQAFYNIVYAYFNANELRLQKGSIDQSIATVKQLIRKAKNKTREIAAIKTQIKLVSNQLRELPSLLSDINSGVKELVRTQVDELKSLVDSIRTFEFDQNLGDAEFERIFAAELKTVEAISNFSISNKAGVAQLARFVAEQSNAVDRFIGSPRREDLIKAQLNRRLVRVAKELISYVEIPLKPNLFIDFVNSAQRRFARLARFARAVKQVDFIQRFVRPKLKRLLTRLKNLFVELRGKIQSKIKQSQAKLESDKEKYAQKKNDSKLKSIFKKAGKTLSAAKKTNNSAIRKESEKVKATRNLIKQTISVSTKLVGLTVGVQQEIATLKQDLETQKRKAKQLSAATERLGQGGFDQNTESNILTTYFDDAGLSAFTQAAVKVMVDTQSSARDVINLVERRSARYKRYGIEIEQLGKQVASIQASINTLFFSSKKTKEQPETKTWVGERLASIKSLLERIVKWLKPKIDRILLWLRTKAEQIGRYIKQKLKKYAEALEAFAINLVPFLSVSKDGKTKKEIVEAKKRLLKDKATKLRATARKVRLLTPALPAITSLDRNLRSGRYKLGANQTHINRIANAIYGYKKEGKLPDQQKAIEEEKRSFVSNFNTLVVVESIVSALIMTSKTIKEDARQEFNQLTEQVKQVVSRVSPSQLQSVDKLKQTIESPPENLQQIERAANIVTQGVLSDINVTNRLVDFEKRKLRRVRQFILSLLEQEGLKKTYQQMIKDGKTSGLFYFAYTELKKIAAAIGKQQSFILQLFRALGRVVSKLLAWIKNTVKKAVTSITKALRIQIKKTEQQTSEELRKRLDKKFNPNALGMTLAFGLAARLFWTGATWTGATGSTHTCLSISRFKKMKARTEDGASGFIRELAQGFQGQLQQMQGIVSPPPVTGIPPIRFAGYI